MKILFKTDFCITRKELNFDRACEEAWEHTKFIFGLDEDGYLRNVKDWQRSTDSISIEFKKMTMYGGMMGWSYCYEFECKVYRS